MEELMLNRTLTRFVQSVMKKESTRKEYAMANNESPYQAHGRQLLNAYSTTPTNTITTTAGLSNQYWNVTNGLLERQWLPDSETIQRMSDIINRQAQTKGKKSAVAVEEPIKIEVAAPDADEAYFVLATKLGVRSAAVTRARLEKFLHEECMGLYDYDKVAAYMSNLAEQAGKEFVWKPIRDKDGHAASKLGNATSWGHGRFVTGAYQHEIPMPVLMSIDKIATAFPDEAIFFASDYEVKRPDPFAAVTTRELWNHDKTLLVFEKWNEPKFRG
jgi:hypothetical protein